VKTIHLCVLFMAAIAVACSNADEAPIARTANSPKAECGSDPSPRVKISEAWVRAAAVTGGNSAGYMIICGGVTNDRLLGVTSSLARATELHETRIDENGLNRMRPLSALPIAQGSQTSFAPGGYHVMLIGLNAPLNDGDNVNFTLNFEKAGEITVTAPVQLKSPVTAGHHDHSGS